VWKCEVEAFPVVGPQWPKDREEMLREKTEEREGGYLPLSTYFHKGHALNNKHSKNILLP